jgi:hypothetical protein
MKTINKSLEPVLRLAIVKSLKNYELTNDSNFLSDLYLYYDAGNQTLVFFDDLEKELFSVNLHDTSVVWGEDILQEIKDTAKYILRELKDEHAFDKEFIYKPFTISMVDNDFIREDELFFIDDKSHKAGSDLWPEINKELDEFLKNLMK